MVSERMALKQYKSAHKVFIASLILAASTGFTCFVILWFGANPIAKSLSNTRIVYSLKALAPTLLIVALMGAFRGYYQGMNTMVPTAISQIIEQVFNAIFSIVLAGVFLKKSIELAAAGGTMGTGIGALAGLIFLVLLYLMLRPRLLKRISNQEDDDYIDESYSDILKTLLSIAIPIIIGTAIFSITNLIDAKMVMSILQSIGMSEIEATGLYGQLTGKYVTLTNLPVSISSALAAAVVPSIAASMALKEKKVVKKKLNLALRVSMILAAPSMAGLFVLGDPILKMLFPSYPGGGDLLRIGSIAIIFLSVVQVATAILQGVGKVAIPARNAAIGTGCKIILNYFLISIPLLKYKGAVISTVICYVIISYLDMKAVKKLTKVKIDAISTFVKPIIASIVMGIFSFIFYRLFLWGSLSNTFATLGSIVLSIVVYCSFLLVIGGVKKEDILLMPKGEIIYNKLVKLGLMS